VGGSTQLERGESNRNNARPQYVLGFHSAGEGQVAGSIYSTVRDLLVLIFARCIKIEQSIWYVMESIYIIVMILMIYLQNSWKSAK
jgi:hypothetical protein